MRRSDVNTVGLLATGWIGTGRLPDQGQSIRVYKVSLKPAADQAFSTWHLRGLMGQISPSMRTNFVLDAPGRSGPRRRRPRTIAIPIGRLAECLVMEPCRRVLRISATRAVGSACEHRNPLGTRRSQGFGCVRHFHIPPGRSRRPGAASVLRGSAHRSARPRRRGQAVLAVQRSVGMRSIPDCGTARSSISGRIHRNA